MTHFKAIHSKSARACRSIAGFSYIWVLITIAVMGFGLVMTVQLDSIIVRRDKEKELLAIGRQFRTAIGRYYEAQMLAGKHEYPASLEDLLKDNRVPGIRRHLRRIFIDPMTGKAEWGLVKVNGRIAGIYSLSEAKPLKQDGFEAEDMGFRNQEKYSGWVFSYPADLMLRIENGEPSVVGGTEIIDEQVRQNNRNKEMQHQ